MREKIYRKGKTKRKGRQTLSRVVLTHPPLATPTFSIFGNQEKENEIEREREKKPDGLSLSHGVTAIYRVYLYIAVCIYL